MFKKEELNASITYTKALEGAKPPPRRKLDIDRDGKLIIYRDLLDKKHISLEVSVENILDKYTFDVLDVKKFAKYSEESNDSDDLEENITDSSDDD